MTYEEPIPLPWGKFWATLSKEEWDEVFETSHLTGDLLARFWRMGEWQGEMPKALRIQVRKKDIDRLICKLEREKR